jgi:hypothetical protein
LQAEVPEKRCFKKLDLSPSPLHHHFFVNTSICDDYLSNHHIIVIDNALEGINNKLQKVVKVLSPREGSDRLGKFSSVVLSHQIILSLPLESTNSSSIVAMMGSP